MTDQKLPVLLIVEDDEGLQRQLKWAYEGYEVVLAGNRSAAVEAVRLHEPSVVTLRSCIASSNADCVLAGARFTSSASRSSVKTGPGTNENSPNFWLYRVLPVMSLGIRSGVN